MRRWIAGLCPDCGSHHGSCAAGFAAPAAPTTSRAAPRFCRSDGSREAGKLTATVSIAIVRRCGSDLCPDCGHRHGSCAMGFAAPAAPTTSRAAPRFCRSDGSREAGELTAAVSIAIVRRWVAGLCPDCVRLGRSCAAGFATCVAPTTAKTTSAAPAFVGATGVAKPANLQPPYRSPSSGAGLLAFVLIAEVTMDLALRVSRLPPLLQHQERLPMESPSGQTMGKPCF